MMAMSIDSLKTLDLPLFFSHYGRLLKVGCHAQIEEDKRCNVKPRYGFNRLLSFGFEAP